MDTNDPTSFHQLIGALVLLAIAFLCMFGTKPIVRDTDHLDEHGHGWRDE